MRLMSQQIATATEEQATTSELLSRSLVTIARFRAAPQSARLVNQRSGDPIKAPRGSTRWSVVSSSESARWRGISRRRHLSCCFIQLIDLKNKYARASFDDA